MTNFEHWLQETLKADPLYKLQIVCNYYDVCTACPCPEVCYKRNNRNIEYLDAPYHEHKKNDTSVTS